MGMLIVHVPQTRQAEHWICKFNLNGSGLRKWIELFLFRLCHGWWSAHTVNGRTKPEFACKYTGTITQSIVLKCAVCRTQKEIRSHSECTHSIPPKSKTSPSPTWSIASSIASSKVCTSGTTSSSESMSMTVSASFQLNAPCPRCLHGFPFQRLLTLTFDGHPLTFHGGCSFQATWLRTISMKKTTRVLTNSPIRLPLLLKLLEDER